MRMSSHQEAATRELCVDFVKISESCPEFKRFLRVCNNSSGGNGGGSDGGGVGRNFEASINFKALNDTPPPPLPPRSPPLPLKPSSRLSPPSPPPPHHRRHETVAIIGAITESGGLARAERCHSKAQLRTSWVASARRPPVPADSQPVRVN